MEQPETKSAFLVKNLLKGILWFVVIIFVFIFLEDYLSENFKESLETLKDRPVLLYGVFFASEVFFGIIPPEFFMFIWVINKVSWLEYCTSLAILTILSYGSGIIGYFVGKNFRKTRFYRNIKVRFMRRFELPLKRYGGYLVFVGAVTPLPFSAMCMLAGSVEFNFRDFLLICLARILRFAIYGYVVWTFPDMIPY